MCNNKQESSIERAKSQAAVMLAFAEGKTIEHQCRDQGGEWRTTDSPGWNWHYYNYRVKREPLTAWGYVTARGEILALTQDESRMKAWRVDDEDRVAKFVEVL